jgi:hypothetical protein
VKKEKDLKSTTVYPHIVEKSTMQIRKNIMIRAEITEIESRKTMNTITKTKSGFFERIGKTGKPLAKLIKEKREESCYKNQY